METSAVGKNSRVRILSNPQFESSRNNSSYDLNGNFFFTSCKKASSHVHSPVSNESCHNASNNDIHNTQSGQSRSQKNNSESFSSRPGSSNYIPSDRHLSSISSKDGNRRYEGHESFSSRPGSSNYIPSDRHLSSISSKDGNRRSEGQPIDSVRKSSISRKSSSLQKQSIHNLENESALGSNKPHQTVDTGYYETLIADSKARHADVKKYSGCNRKSLGVRALPKSKYQIYPSTYDQRKAFEKGVTQSTYSHVKMFRMFMGDRCRSDPCERPRENAYEEDFKKNCWQIYRDEQLAKKTCRGKRPKGFETEQEDLPL